MRNTLVLIGPLALLACGNRNFNTPQLLKTPRVLAIQAEPPQPSVGTSTTLRALIYLPPVHSDTAECAGVDPAAKYQWSWCPVPTSSGDGYQCHIQQADVDALARQLGLGQVPQVDPATGEIDLGTGETATLTNPFPAQILDGICTGAINLSPRPDAGTGAATPNGGSVSICDQDQSGQPRFGYPVTITLRYTPPCGSPPQDNFGPTLTTVFTVLLPRDDSTPGNQNPVVGGIQATWGGASDGASGISGCRDQNMKGIFFAAVKIGHHPRHETRAEILERAGRSVNSRKRAGKNSFNVSSSKARR